MGQSARPGAHGAEGSAHGPSRPPGGGANTSGCGHGPFGKCRHRATLRRRRTDQQVLEREILDWNRFENRRQVASLTGMCPGVHSSGSKTRSGPITKHGNRRIRTALVELAWRCLYFQPEYPPLKKWRPVLLNTKTTGAAKKKAIVAVGRRLAIDLWRLNTGRTTSLKLGLK
jgi:hypothetical protein